MHNRLRIVSALLALSFVVAGCAKKDSDEKTEDSAKAMAAAPADRHADAAAIMGMDSAWMRFVVAKNVDSLMTMYTSDAVSYSPGAAPAR